MSITRDKQMRTGMVLTCTKARGKVGSMSMSQGDLTVKLVYRQQKATTTPFVIGAVMDPGNCLNLLESNSLRLLEDVYHFLREAHETARIPMAENKVDAKTHELLRRNLDCAVIESLHTSNQERGMREYDTVRGVFVEGRCLYPNSGFHKKNYMQICVRNAQCIMGLYYCPELPTGGGRGPASTSQ